MVITNDNEPPIISRLYQDRLGIYADFLLKHRIIGSIEDFFDKY